jgi:hypothetical protein
MRAATGIERTTIDAASEHVTASMSHMGTDTGIQRKGTPARQFELLDNVADLLEAVWISVGRAVL